MSNEEQKRDPSGPIPLAEDPFSPSRPPASSQQVSHHPSEPSKGENDVRDQSNDASRWQSGQQPSEPSAPPEFSTASTVVPASSGNLEQPRPIERQKGPARTGARGTAAMDPQTRKEVARKGGLAVSRNKQHMAEIGRKGGQSVSKNREHMAQIGRKGGAASRGHR